MFYKVKGDGSVVMLCVVVSGKTIFIPIVCTYLTLNIYILYITYIQCVRDRSINIILYISTYIPYLYYVVSTI